MNVFKKSVLLAAAMPMALAALASPVYFENDFSKTKLPSSIILTQSGPAYVQSMYKQSVIKDKWVRAEVGAKGGVAVVPTHTDQPGVAFLRTMTTPAFTVDNADAIIRWQGRSVLPDFEEAYRVVAIDNDGIRTEIFSTEEEADWWTWHSFSLAEFLNKEIKISFECFSDNKYMLAIDDIFIGVPDAPLWDVTVLSPVFQSMEDGFVKLNIANHGAPQHLLKVKTLVNGAVDGEFLFDKDFDSNEEHVFTVPVTPQLNTKVAYQVQLEFDNGSPVTVLNNDVYFSTFRKKQVVDKATGTWCNGCPIGTVDIQAAKRKYGDQLIVIEAHARPDVLAVEDYWQNLDFYAAPYFMVNRNHHVKFGTFENVENSMFRPADADIKITDIQVDAESRMLHLTADVTFAEDLDNTDGTYRLGYCFTHKVYDPSYATTHNQQNNCTLLKYEQYYHLPAIIPQWINVMHDVNVSGAEAMFGVENTLPANFTAMNTQSAQISVPLPENISDFNDEARIALYVLKKGTFLNSSNKWIDVAEILNTDAYRFADFGSVSAHPVIGDNIADDDADATPVYYDLQGRVVTNPASGIYIVRTGTKTKKIVKK